MIIIPGHRHWVQCRRHRYSVIQHLSPVPEHSGTGLYSLIPVPVSFRHRFFIHSGTGLAGRLTSGISASKSNVWRIHPPRLQYTVGGGDGYTLHVHTDDGVDGYTLHAQTESEGKGYTLHVFTPRGGEGYTLTSTLLAVKRDTPSSSLGRYVFGSEISYNKAPPRLPGLGC